jgi:kynureninase
MTTTKTVFKASREFALSLDKEDELQRFRKEFILPQALEGSDKRCVYLTGNSLGLQPRKTRQYICDELDDWAALGVEGHLKARHPWLPYHEFLTEMSANVVGAKPSEVVVMNTLTVNLHLMMVSFYRPTKSRYKILVEKNAFPSDQYAVASQASFHGFDPKDGVIEAAPRSGCDLIATEDILHILETQGEEIALVVLGDVNYLTGQAFEVKKIVKEAHKHGVLVGLNLAHGAGNLLLQLHDWNVDFAVWCSYKYLNAGPGGIAGCFVHERHGHSFDLPRFAGWWGHDKVHRFKMDSVFNPMPGAEGWQLSNPPIFQLAALRASLSIFEEATMPKLRAKGDLLTAYLEFLLTEALDEIKPGFLKIITPSDKHQRGSQLSIRFIGDSKSGKMDSHGLLEAFKEKGVVCDFREPDIIRATPAPLYNSFEDVYSFYEVVKEFAAR